MSAIYLSIWRPIQRAFQAAWLFICHAALAAIIICTIWALERLIYLLWDGRERLLLDLVPLRYMFDGMDIGVILIFVFFGFRDAVEAFANRADLVPKLPPSVEAE